MCMAFKGLILSKQNLFFFFHENVIFTKNLRKYRPKLLVKIITLGPGFSRDFCSDPIIGLRVRPATHITLIKKIFSFLKKKRRQKYFHYIYIFLCIYIYIYIYNVLQICRRPMRPIIRSATHNKVRRDPILGRDPWFENPGSR